MSGVGEQFRCVFYHRPPRVVLLLSAAARITVPSDIVFVRMSRRYDVEVDVE